MRLLALLLLLPVCAHAQTQHDLNVAEGRKLAIADMAMNAAHGRLMAKISPAGQTALRDAQRNWLRFRDTECDFETLATINGTIHPLEVALCRTRLTRVRTRDLTAQLDCGEGDVSCGGQ